MKIAVVASILVLCACDTPDFPVPPQRPRLETPAFPMGRILQMSDPGVTHRFVRDISSDLSTTWRWAFQRPAVRIHISTVHPFKYVMDLATPELTLRDTGPVTITFTVNDRVLDRVRYSEPGEHHFEKEIPTGWVRADEDAIVGGEIDKMWVSPSDGARFGFIISSIGLSK